VNAVPAIPTLREIERARAAFPPSIVRTPLIRYRGAPEREIYLKLESLQPIGSFKLRGAAAALGQAEPAQVAQGVITASAGNMAQGVAWIARERGIPCHVVLPDHAPQTKRAAIERLGGALHPVPFDRWWRTLSERGFDGLEGFFIHPVSDAPVICGNASIGLELYEDLPRTQTVIAPYGGGGLSTGIASALRAVGSSARVYAAEIDRAAPLTAALAANEPVAIDYRPSFVDGIGGKGLLPEMWPLAQKLLAGALCTSADDIAEAIRALVRFEHIVAEGAGAAALACALASDPPEPIVCVVSGGNLDHETLATILDGETPGPH